MKHFRAQELVTPECYQKFGVGAYKLFDQRALNSLAMIRKVFGRTTVNNWHYGGNRTESGLRVSGMKHYRKYSQHSFGRAFDCLMSNVSTEEVIKYITANPKKFPYIKGIEVGVSWLHIDCRNSDKIRFFGR